VERSPPRPVLAYLSCRLAALLRFCAAMALLGPIACGLLAPPMARAQIVGADGRIRSGVTFGNGRELGPQVAFQGLQGVAVWYEDQGLAPIHSAFTADGGVTWIPGGFVPGQNPLGNASLTVDGGARFFESNLVSLPFSANAIEVRRGELVGSALVWQAEVQVASGTAIEHPTIACDPVSG